MIATERQSSPSPSRRLSLSNKISAISARIGRSLSSGQNDSDRDSITSTVVAEGDSTTKDRSVSRGRDAFHSSGRGGIGNIRQASASRDARPDSGPDDFSSSRGREPISNPAQIFSTGRGGAGNIRSPSRDTYAKTPVGPDIAEQEVVDSYVTANRDAVHSTGRGGVGNMTRSRSRGPSAPSTPGGPVHSSGRGGAGNFSRGDGHEAEAFDEEERRKRAHADGAIHSTGRGGAANMAHSPSPGVERLHHQSSEYASTGRGGAGNIIRDRSASRNRA